MSGLTSNSCLHPIFYKTYLADGKPGNFSLYPASNMVVKPSAEKIPQFENHTTFDDRGRGEFVVPEPIATGKTIILAPEDPERYVKIQSETEIMLFDGRNLAENGWFVVRSLIPSGKTGNVLQWYVKPNAIPNWIRTPVIGFNQAGYHPGQEKVAVIELDKADIPLKKASLFKVTPEGESVEKLSADLEPWGKYLRYNYVKFNFSSVRESGLYFIKYGDQKTNTFVIDAGVYDKIWHRTLDVWFPVQMDHMEVVRHTVYGTGCPTWMMRCRPRLIISISMGIVWDQPPIPGLNLLNAFPDWQLAVGLMQVTSIYKPDHITA